MCPLMKRQGQASGALKAGMGRILPLVSQGGDSASPGTLRDPEVQECRCNRRAIKKREGSPAVRRRGKTDTLKHIEKQHCCTTKG